MPGATGDGGLSMGIDWDSLRESEFPVTRRWAYFDHAATAPLPGAAAT